MREIGDKFNVSKSTIFECRNKVCSALAECCQDFIKWPQNADDVSVTETEFAEYAKFPGLQENMLHINCAVQLHKHHH